MTLEDVQRVIYECKVGRCKAPVRVLDVLPNGVIGTNLDTKREVFIKKEQLSRIGPVIENMNEWRLRNGEERV